MVKRMNQSGSLDQLTHSAEQLARKHSINAQGIMEPVRTKSGWASHTIPDQLVTTRNTDQPRKMRLIRGNVEERYDYRLILSVSTQYMLVIYA